MAYLVVCPPHPRPFPLRGGREKSCAFVADEQEAAEDAEIETKQGTVGQFPSNSLCIHCELLVGIFVCSVPETLLSRTWRTYCGSSTSASRSVVSVPSRSLLAS